MSTFVLVHGGAHGAWCWDRLLPLLLANSGVEDAVAVDLTGHGIRSDVKPLDAVTLDDDVDDVVRVVEMLEEMFCSDLDQATCAWLLGCLGAEPPGPMAEPVTVATAPAGVGSTYILLERGRALPPAYQREQARNAEVDEVVSFDAGHSAFASRPEALAEPLVRCANR